MDEVLLESFVTVADAGSITAASDRLHVSQSALSRRLQQLEAELGADLLTRGRHGVALTELGRETIEHARRIVARYDRMRREVAEHLGLQRGIVRIGGGATVTSYLLPPAIARFQESHPGIQFYVKEAGSHEVAADVASGGLEVGVVTLPLVTRELEVDELSVDEIVLVARRGHPVTRRPVTVADLSAHTFIAFEQGSAIRQIIDSRLHDAGVDVDVVMELRSIPSILRMVATTRSLAFVSRVSVPSEPAVRTVRVRGLSIARTLALVRRQDVPLSVPAAAFVDELRAL